MWAHLCLPLQGEAQAQGGTRTPLAHSDKAQQAHSRWSAHILLLLFLLGGSPRMQTQDS